MNRLTLVSLYRSLVRYRTNAALNLGGLTIGIAVFLILGLYARFETSFEKWLPDYQQIYVVENVWNVPGSPFDGPSQTTMGGLLEELRADFPDTLGTRINGGEKGGSVFIGGISHSENVAQVDHNFLDIFKLRMVDGDGHALEKPTATLISRSIAKKYFGNANPLGKTLRVATGEEALDYSIGGVFEDLPANSDLKISILVPIPDTPAPEQWHSWGSASLATYLLFPDEAAARVFESRLQAFVDRHALRDMGPGASKILRLKLLPLADAHLEPQGSANKTAKMKVITLSLVGLLTLLIAIINYINLATARANLRAREIAMRKVLGASRQALVRQFLGEAILVVTLAALLGLILAELGLPFINAAGGLALSIPYALVVPVLALIAVLVGTVAGIYPALLLSHFPAAAVLASARSPGGGRNGNRIREALVVLQFGFAIAFLTMTMILVAQTRHVRNTDLGFDRQGLLVIASLQDAQVDASAARLFAERVRQIPGVRSVGTASSAAGGSNQNFAATVAIPGKSGNGPSLRWVMTGPNFFASYRPRLLAGRLFDDQHGTDDSTGLAEKHAVQNIVINRRAVGILGFNSPQDAIGKIVGSGSPMAIVGVIDQLRFLSPRQADDPTYFLYSRDITSGHVATIRFDANAPSIVDSVRSTWQQTIPQVPFDAELVDRRLAKFYEDDDRTMRLFGIGTGLAVIIGCVGLWGLALFNTQRRVKEVGIRKTLGACGRDIMKLLVGQFLRPVFLANIIAWPVAFFAARVWLANFDDRITLSPLYFLGASALATIIAILTVAAHSNRASKAPPSWALRHE
ncbi:MAG: FtsX-like permease family protein [Novosphingobium sp.]|nr:FtsX-like permease family protein [Novosphingobium sp.]